MYDAIIVGGSVAGSSLAALLGRRGFRTLLLDRSIFPRRKVCGEGLMPPGVRILEEFGLTVRARLTGARPFSGLRFHIDSGRSLELDFSESDPSTHGLTMCRENLDGMLLDHAAAQPNVEVREGFNVQRVQVLGDHVEVRGGDKDEVCTGRVMVGADGIRSRFPKALGMERRNPRPGRFALRAEFQKVSGLDRFVEVFCSPRGEAYVTPLGDERVRITLLIDDPEGCRPLHGKAGELYEAILGGFPSLTRRMRSPRPQGVVEATAPVCQRLPRCHASRTLLVGDAAGAVDPVTGQGMTLALRDARLACETLAEGLEHDRLREADLAHYSECRNRHFAVSFGLAQNLLFVLRRPFIAKQAAKAISRNRQMRLRLLSLATELQPQPPLTHLEHLRLLFGF